MALDVMMDAVYIIDMQGVVQYVNAEFLRFFDLQAHEVLQLRLKDVAYPYEDMILLAEEDEQMLATQQAQKIFYDFHGQSNYKVNQVRSTKAPLHAENGAMMGVVTTITIIGENFMNSNLLARGVKHYQNIQQLTYSISGLNSEQAILWELAEECAKLLALTDCVIYMHDENLDVLVQKAAFGAKDKSGEVLSPVTLKIGQGIVGQAAALKQTLVVADLSKNENYYKDEFAALSEISVPIIFQDKIIGVIDSESPEYGFYSSKHKDFLEAIAGIAALKIAELRNLKKVKEKEQFLNQVLESPKDLMAYSIDREYRYQSFNQNHARMMKEYFDVDIALGMDALSFITDEAEKKEYAMSFEMALKGSDFGILEKYPDKSGQDFIYLDKLYSPLYDINGEIIGVTAFIRDVTDEKIVTLKLEDRERLIQTINENIKDGIFRYSVTRGFLYSNSALLALFGIEPPGDKIVDFDKFHVYKNNHLKIYNEIFQKGSVENREVYFRRTDGSTFWGLLDCTLSQDGEDQVIDGVITNITMLKEMSQNLIKTNSEMDQLVYRTSHDLRAPIASLLGLESLLEHRITDTEQRDLLAIMKNQLHLLDSIIMDIITYRKVAKLGLSKDVINLEEMIQKVFNGMQFMENYDQIQRQVNVKSTGVFVSDAHNVQVIFNNLLSNAIKYSKKGKKGIVKVSVEVDAQRALIVIEDNGIGIEEDYLSRVFNMFYRATNHASGTGLGLFIVKEAVNKLNGEISLKSEQDSGSVFTVKLPNQVLKG